MSGVIAIGTTRSLVFVYDYLQNLKCILGNSARGKEKEREESQVHDAKAFV